jgi:hypothetical protein
MIRIFYIISKPGEKIRPPIYSISSHRFPPLIAPKFPILLVILTVWQKKDSDFTKQAKNMLINIDVQQILTQNICPSHPY